MKVKIDKLPGVKSAKIGDIVAFHNGQVVLVGEDPITGEPCGYSMDGRGTIPSSDFAGIPDDQGVAYSADEYILEMTKK